MLKRLLATMIAAGLIAAGEAPAALAQEPAKQHALSTAAGRSQLRDEIARMTSLSPNEIEIHATNAMLRVVLINTVYNTDPASDREYLASTISALVNKNAASDPRYKAFFVLHVEFANRGRLSTRPVDRMEFRRGADGAFVRHRT
jgi:hypothetical protein